jgi:hypothetical protein
MAYRFRKTISGGRVNKNRIIGNMIFYIAISFLAALASFQIGIHIGNFFGYIGLFIVSTFLSYRFVERKLTFWKADDGFIHVKGGIFPYIIWMVGLVTRFSLEYFFIGTDFLTSMATKKTPSTSTIEITLIIDLILMIGVGALTGRNLQILAKLKTISAKI